MAKLAKEHFYKIDDPATARALFKYAVNNLSIETSSFCNRRCSYCPDSHVDRISEKKYLSMDEITKMLSNLAEIDYSGIINFSLFNEPLADPNIAEKVSMAKQACPNAKVSMYTNGDYLKKDYLDRLREAGLDIMTVSLHIANNVPWSDDKVIERIADLSARLGVGAKIHNFQSGMAVLGRLPDPKIEIRLSHFDYNKVGWSRAGLNENLIPPDMGNKPCLEPFEQFLVSWDGEIVPCCQINTDVSDQHAYRIGNIRDFPDIFAAYAASSLVGWRRGLASGEKRLPPCDTCAVHVSDPAEVDRIHQFYAGHVGDKA